MYTLLFTPKAFLSNTNKENYLVNGYITIDVVEIHEDLNNCVFASKIHYKLYNTLKEYGTFELVNSEDL